MVYIIKTSNGVKVFNHYQPAEDFAKKVQAKVFMVSETYYEKNSLENLTENDLHMQSFSSR